MSVPTPKERKLLPLFPTFADPERWRPPSQTEKSRDEDRRSLRLRVMRPEDYTCQYCGHRAEKYQIAHHLDEDPENNTLDNLSVICQMCNVVMHSGQGCVVQGVVDLYKESKFAQGEIIQLTRRMRFDERKNDDEIIAFLGLQKKMPFVMDKQYLARLFGFVSSRPSREADIMYENWRRYELGRSTQS